MGKHLIFESKQAGFDAIPVGKKVKITLEGETICLVNSNNAFHALSNSCPHLGESLVKGTLNFTGEIVCPWHSYRFNLKSGEESSRRCRDVRIFRVTEEEGAIYIDI